MDSENLQQNEQFNYSMEYKKSVSTLKSAGNNSVIINFDNCIISPATTLFFPVTNQATIVGRALHATLAYSRKFYVGDKKHLNPFQQLFTQVTFNSNEITFSSQNLEIFNNLLYYKDYKRQNAAYQIKTARQSGANRISDDIFLDPLLIHDIKNRGFTNITGTRQAVIAYEVGEGVVLDDIAADTFVTFLPVSLKQLLPGIFDFQDIIYVTNASLTINFAANPYITMYDVVTASGLTATTRPYVTTNLVNLKFINDSQIFVQNIQNYSSPLSYQIQSNLEAKELMYDLQSISQKITFDFSYFFALIFYKPITAYVNDGTLPIQRDMFELENTDIIINEIKIGKNTIYKKYNTDTYNQSTQKRALETVSQVIIPFQHLSFFTFLQPGKEENVSIDLSSGTLATMKVLIYIINQKQQTMTNTF